MTSGPTEPPGPTGTVPPVRRSVLVQAGVDACWTALTGRIGSWWPFPGHSCTDDPQSALGFVDGDLVETGRDGARYVWGSVLRWEPPHGLVMSWHPGASGASGVPTEVEWRLTAIDPGATLVEVVHRGWERLADPGASRATYAGGWPAVVAALAAALDVDTSPSSWFVLTHSAGPGADPDTPLYRQPRFARHEEFLQALADDGLLVAAGPLPARVGQGRTIVRGVTAEEARRRAEHDDEAVRSGFLTVDIEPWLVVRRG